MPSPFFREVGLQLRLMLFQGADLFLQLLQLQVDVGQFRLYLPVSEIVPSMLILDQCLDFPPVQSQIGIPINRVDAALGLAGPDCLEDCVSQNSSRAVSLGCVEIRCLLSPHGRFMIRRTAVV